MPKDRARANTTPAMSRRALMGAATAADVAMTSQICEN